jgi:hypothetical protein
LDHEPTSNWNIKKTKLQKPIQKPSLIINDVWIKVPWNPHPTDRKPSPYWPEALTLTLNLTLIPTLACPSP